MVIEFTDAFPFDLDVYFSFLFRECNIMNILDILDGDLIISDLSAENKKDVLQELTAVLAKKRGNIEQDALVEVLLEREKLGSTGIGDGVAIPHGKLKKLDRIIASFGRSLKGLDFQSMDGKPTHLFFLLVAPENSGGAHLKALARISRLLKDASFRKRLLEAKSKENIFRVIAEEDKKVPD
jgi:PTS system nitrogen regulatory IIA component